jgi:hypothetical protein
MKQNLKIYSFAKSRYIGRNTMKIRVTILSIFSFFILTCWPITTHGQAPADNLLLDEQALKKVKVYNDLYSAFKKPDEVFILDLRGQN